MAYDVPEPCESLSRDSYRKWFLSADKEVDPGPHALIGLVLYVGRADIFPHALSLESLDPFLEVSKQDPCLTDVEEDGDNKRLVELELACKADGVAPSDPVKSCLLYTSPSPRDTIESRMPSSA